MGFDLRHPADVKRLAGRNRDLIDADQNRQAALGLGIAAGHDVGNAAHINLQRIDAQIGQLGIAGQPLGQRVDVERLAIADTGQPRVAQSHQRVQGAVAGSKTGLGAFDLL